MGLIKNVLESTGHLFSVLIKMFVSVTLFILGVCDVFKDTLSNLILFFNFTLALVSLMSMISAGPFQFGTNFGFFVVSKSLAIYIVNDVDATKSSS